MTANPLQARRRACALSASHTTIAGMSLCTILPFTSLTQFTEPPIPQDLAGNPNKKANFRRSPSHVLSLLSYGSWEEPPVPGAAAKFSPATPIQTILPAVLGQEWRDPPRPGSRRIEDLPERAANYISSGQII